MDSYNTYRLNCRQLMMWFFLLNACSQNLVILHTV